MTALDLRECVHGYPYSECLLEDCPDAAEPAGSLSLIGPSVARAVTRTETTTSGTHRDDTPALCELLDAPELLREARMGWLYGAGERVEGPSDGAPWLLDLFCGAGGAAMGYHRAGWNVLGVDVDDQPRYPFAFVQADALALLEGGGAEGFVGIHASPPCQAFSAIRALTEAIHGERFEYAELVEPTRELLIASGLVYAIENVVGAPLRNAVQLCGSSFGLPLQRHRLFESNVALLAPACAHGAYPAVWKVPVGDPRRRLDEGGSSRLSWCVAVYGSTRYRGEDAHRRAAMGIDWMRRHELTQAIPPAYTELVGTQLRNATCARAA